MLRLRHHPLRELSGGGIAWTDGMLYPVLHRLEPQGLIQSRWGESETGRNANTARCEPAVRMRCGSRKNNGRWCNRRWLDCGGATCLTSNDVSRTGGGALAETAGCTDEVLNELESHLRDEMQRLVQTGEPEERALDLALAQLGPPQVLGAEFAKLARDGRPRRGCRCDWLTACCSCWPPLWSDIAPAGCRTRHPPGQPRRRRDARLLHHAPGRRVGLLLRGDAILPPPRPAQLGADAAVFVMTWLALAATALGVFLGGVWAKDNLGQPGAGT